MATHISVLPVGILETLAIRLNESPETKSQTATGIDLLRLPHPRTGVLSLYLPAKSANSILEIQNVAPNASRSWFLEGEVVSDGSMLLMTPVDTAFLLLPFLRAASPQDGSLGNFRTLDDIFEEAATKLAKTDVGDGTNEGETIAAYLSTAAILGELPCVGEAMRFVCEVKDVTSDLVVYRYSQTKLIEYLVKKATRLSKNGIVDKSRTLERELAKDGLMDDGKEELLQSGRLRLACDLISQYVPSDIHEELLSKFNFTALTAHSDALQAVSAHQTATANGVAQKLLDEQEQEQDAKKRKAVVQASRGVEKLKKASVKGMAKLSTFFQKGPKT